MEKRVVIAIVLCILVLFLWEKFFVPKRKPIPPGTSPEVEQTAPAQEKPRHHRFQLPPSVQAGMWL